MSETQLQPGGLPIPSETRVATDGTTIAGDGSAEHPLRSLAGGGPSYLPGVWTGTLSNPGETQNLALAGSVGNIFSPSRDGSIAGISAAINKYVVAAGTITLEVLVNNEVVAQIVIGAGGAFFGTFAKGASPYRAGDSIAVAAAASADLDPLPASMDVFVALWEGQ